MNPENLENAEIILNCLSKHMKDPSNAKVLDICAGAYDKNGVNYDSKGDIYEPIVAQTLGKIGYNVTGVDFRKNNFDGQKNVVADLFYQPINDINILDGGWEKSLEGNWDCVIFLRSWDTPEILLYFQKLLKISDLNLLCVEIAKNFLPIFSELLSSNGLLFTTDICNFALCDDEFEENLFQTQSLQLFKQNHFTLLETKNGLHCFQKI